MLYNRGEGVTENPGTALGWFPRAGENGFSDTMYAMGNCFANGWEVAKNCQEALHWSCQARSLGNRWAIQLLGPHGEERCGYHQKPKEGLKRPCAFQGCGKLKFFTRKTAI